MKEPSTYSGKVLALGSELGPEHVCKNVPQPASGAKMPFPVPCLLDGKLETYQGPQDIAGFGFFGTPGVTFYGAKMNRVQWLPPAVVDALNSHAANERKIAGLVEELEAVLEWTRGDKQAAEHGDMVTEIDAATLQARVLSLRAALALAREGGAK